MIRRLVWERKSSRLWVAEHEGNRRFRILRDAHGGIGGVSLVEVDRLHREIRKAYAKGFVEAANAAEEWITDGSPG